MSAAAVGTVSKSTNSLLGPQVPAPRKEASEVDSIITVEAAGTSIISRLPTSSRYVWLQEFRSCWAGNISQFIVHQLLKAKVQGAVHEVIVLTREGSQVSFDGARMATVDYGDQESLRATLVGIDVVISAISETVLDVQLAIVKAAKAAGVQLFVPSEYGDVAEGGTEGFQAVKLQERRVDQRQGHWFANRSFLHRNMAGLRMEPVPPARYHAR
ncbi:hypothetical protein BC834DRAFT_604520 [Gloeopeniophorella convolvens]|nr:hypothetical protein BC834DRAFT_604520 [Gloeopeniophorella convolvens]